MLEVGRGIRVGQQAHELLELQCPLARGGVLESATKDDRPADPGSGGRDPLGCGLDLEGGGDGRRQRGEKSLGAGVLRTQRQRKEGNRGQFGHSR